MLLGRPPSLASSSSFLFFPQALLPPLLIHSPDDSGVDFFQWASPLQNGQGEGCMPIKGPRARRSSHASSPEVRLLCCRSLSQPLRPGSANQRSTYLWPWNLLGKSACNDGRTTDGLILNGFCVNVGITTASKSFVAHWFSPLLPVSICHVGWDCVIRRGWLWPVPQSKRHCPALLALQE